MMKLLSRCKWRLSLCFLALAFSQGPCFAQSGATASVNEHANSADPQNAPAAAKESDATNQPVDAVAAEPSQSLEDDDSQDPKNPVDGQNATAVSKYVLRGNFFQRLFQFGSIYFTQPLHCAALAGLVVSTLT
jgi:hypothetical protein